MIFSKKIQKAVREGLSFLTEISDNVERRDDEFIKKQNVKRGEGKTFDEVLKSGGSKKIPNDIKHSLHRRTDDELSLDKSGLEKKPTDFSYKAGVHLSDAVRNAPSEPGVYILWLKGSVMKCGRASYLGGVRWRFTQYYNLNYDNRARAGDFWSVTKENRDDIKVSWQCCPPSKCHELEYKLFKKYGKGPWAERAPNSCDTNSWKLLI